MGCLTASEKVSSNNFENSRIQILDIVDGTSSQEVLQNTLSLFEDYQSTRLVNQLDSLSRIMDEDVIVRLERLKNDVNNGKK